MSSELRDFRGKITVETHVALMAEARVNGQDQSEIVREILHAWALRKLDVATVMHRLLRDEGIATEDGGARGTPK